MNLVNRTINGRVAKQARNQLQVSVKIEIFLLIIKVSIIKICFRQFHIAYVTDTNEINMTTSNENRIRQCKHLPDL